MADVRLNRVAKVYPGGVRAADDITLSFETYDRKRIRYLIRFVAAVVHTEGYRLHGSRTGAICGLGAPSRGRHVLSAAMTGRGGSCGAAMPAGLMWGRLRWSLSTGWMRSETRAASGIATCRTAAENHSACG